MTSPQTLIFAITCFFLPNLIACRGVSRPADAQSKDNECEAVLPPMPDFKKPVDYVVWYTERNYPSEAPLGDSLYSALNTIDAPDKAAGRQLTAAAAGPWSQSDFPELAEHIRRVSEHLQPLVAATNTAEVTWDLTIARKSGFLVPPKPETRAFRYLCMTILAKAWHVENKENLPAPEVLLQAWGACLNCANHIEKRYGVTTCLLAMSIRHYVYLAICKGLRLGILDETSINRLLDLLAARARIIPIDEAYRFELMSLFDLLQRLYPNGKFSDAAAEKVGATEYLPPRGFLLPPPETTATKAREYYHSLIELASAELSLAGCKRMLKLDREREHIQKGNNILSMYLPSLIRTYELSVYHETLRRGTILALAINRFQKHEGRWPVGFYELNEQTLMSVKKDPYSDSGFVYRVNAGVPILYSLGYDGKDNDGVHDGKAYRKSEYDIVIIPCPEDERPQ